MDVVEITLRGRLRRQDGAVELIEIEQRPAELNTSHVLRLAEMAVKAIAAKEQGSRPEPPVRRALYHLPCPVCGALYTENECPVCEARAIRLSATEPCLRGSSDSC